MSLRFTIIEGNHTAVRDNLEGINYGCDSRETATMLFSLLNSLDDKIIQQRALMNKVADVIEGKLASATESEVTVGDNEVTV